MKEMKAKRTNEGYEVSVAFAHEGESREYRAMKEKQAMRFLARYFARLLIEAERSGAQRKVRQ